MPPIMFAMLHLYSISMCRILISITTLTGEDDSGVNIRFIFEWIWERLETVIYTFDRSCVPLYDWSGLPADSLCKQSLLSSITQTKNIISILQHISLLIKRISHIKLGESANCLP